MENELNKNIFVVKLNQTYLTNDWSIRYKKIPIS